MSPFFSSHLTTTCAHNDDDNGMDDENGDADVDGEDVDGTTSDGDGLKEAKWFTIFECVFSQEI